MGTGLYQLYDGTLKVHGCKKLLWHRKPIDERKLQMVDDRRFPFAPENKGTPVPAKRRKRRPKAAVQGGAAWFPYALAAALAVSILGRPRPGLT